MEFIAAEDEFVVLLKPAERFAERFGMAPHIQ